MTHVLGITDQRAITHVLVTSSCDGPAGPSRDPFSGALVAAAAGLPRDSEGQ